MGTLGQCMGMGPGLGRWGSVQSWTRVGTLGQCRVWDSGGDARAV